MLCEAYIEALLIDEHLADRVQAALEFGAIDEMCAFQAWCLIALETNKGGSESKRNASRAAETAFRPYTETMYNIHCVA
jgi:hypothetical protein